MNMELEYHKGKKCPFKAIFCQEGYCSECEVGKEICVKCGAHLRYWFKEMGEIHHCPDGWMVADEVSIEPAIEEGK